VARLAHRAATELLAELRHDVLDPQRVAWEDWARRMSALDGRDWLLLDKLARRATWAQPALLHGTRGWDSLDLAAAPTPAVAAAAMHVDGRLRERAARALSGHGGPVASAVLALRILDHVPQVASAAREVVARHPVGLEVDLIADVLLQGADRRTAEGRWVELVDTLSLNTPSVLGLLRISRHRKARRWAVEQSLEQGLLDADTALQVASKDPDQWLRRAAAEHLTRTPSPEQLGPLLRADSVEARLTALTRVPEDLLDEATLEQLLMDRAPRVREQARWRARRRGVDVADVCRRRLGDAIPRVVVAALDGLTWTGNETDVPAVAELLQHPSPTVRAAAVRTFAARVPGPQATQTLAPYLDDPSGRVSGAAATVLARAGAPASVATQAWQSPLPTARRAAWRVARSAGGWTRVAADLRAATDPDSNLSGLGQDGVRGWLRDGAATTWGRPDPEDAQSMADRLPAAGLNDTEAERVAFHAGLPFTRRAFTVTPQSDGPNPAPRRRGPRNWFRRRGH
jgi:hypothetical protein